VATLVTSINLKRIKAKLPKKDMKMLWLRNTL